MRPSCVFRVSCGRSAGLLRASCCRLPAVGWLLLGASSVSLLRFSVSCFPLPRFRAPCSIVCLLFRALCALCLHLRFLRLLSFWSVWAVVLGVPLSLLLVGVAVLFRPLGRSGLVVAAVALVCGASGVGVVAPLLWCRCLLQGFGPPPVASPGQKENNTHGTCTAWRLELAS